MKYLLDTHAFIWWDSRSKQLSPRVHHLIADDSNDILLSVASLWEIQIKHQLGKLDLNRSFSMLVNQQITDNYFDILPIEVQHVMALESLPLIHKDPFDRILIAQAQAENAILVTNDPLFTNYPVTVLW